MVDTLIFHNNTNFTIGIYGNQSGEGTDLINQFLDNRKIDEPFYSVLIAFYSFLIIFGSTGNILVVLAVLRNKQMQTARQVNNQFNAKINIFIVNLAISDLLLCLVTMPLTLIEILSKYWPLGNTWSIIFSRFYDFLLAYLLFVNQLFLSFSGDSALLCKMIGALQGTSIFVSTISITAIALDRYQVIVGCPAKDNLKMLGAVLILTLIWFIALMCAAPLFIYRSLIHYNINIASMDFQHKISYCDEEWPQLPFFDGRVYYSIFSLALQYLIPILVVTSSYLKIYFRLKKRFVITQNAPAVGERIQNRRGRRMKRTNCLLISIALIFGISWLPLNFFNLYADLTGMKSTQNVYIIYAACHMAGMSSACSNPLLYGWLNDNFKKEFNEIICCKKLGSESRFNLKAIDAGFVTKQRRAYTEVTDIDKQSKLLSKPQDNQILPELKPEFTVTSTI
ncbi:CLUMA_CG005664, isoform A [Clunio marinus]|uniref:CLUMA_CG005664, isoform A n=1 Tax=Clunio marinus TaxID=568069 RepID=A0A1J1HX48_9DIPT|nr:CLUMA_CG005664, isoform A [Clunio marinus]